MINYNAYRRHTDCYNRAGIIGLDVALVLAEQGYGSQTTVIAQHLPGDTSTEYTSPWAGANFSGLSGSDENALVWDNTGYKRLLDLARTHGIDAAVKRTRSYEYWDEEPAKEKIESMARYLEDVSRYRRDGVPTDTHTKLSSPSSVRIN